MKKIVYPILLLVLTACKGNQQTTNNESAAIPVAETIADTIAQPEVVQSPNQKIPDRKTKCVIKTHINIKQNVIFGAKLKPV